MKKIHKLGKEFKKSKYWKWLHGMKGVVPNKDGYAIYLNYWDKNGHHSDWFFVNLDKKYEKELIPDLTDELTLHGTLSLINSVKKDHDMHIRFAGDSKNKKEFLCGVEIFDYSDELTDERILDTGLSFRTFADLYLYILNFYEKRNGK